MRKQITVWTLLLAMLIHPVLAGASEKKETQPNNPAQDLVELPFKAAGTLADSIFDLGGIVVGGKRLSSPMNEFAENSVTSTTVIGRRELIQRDVQNIPQAFEDVPGVLLSDLSGNGEEATIDFRGFNEGDDFVFLLDGVRLNEAKSNNINYALIPISMIDRIEVNRGGASFLYGEGAMAGAVNLVALTPTQEGVHAKIKTGVESFDGWQESFETTVKQDGFGLAMTGDLYHSRGFRKNTSVEKEDFYTKASWNPTDVLKMGASYLYADAHLDRSGSIRESYLRDMGRKATERPRNFADMDTHLGILDFQLQPIESAALSGNVYARQSHEISVANFATFVRDDNELDLTNNTWGTTIQLDHSKDVMWDLVEGFLIGVDYAENSIDEEDFNRSKVTLSRLGNAVDSTSEKDVLGVFGKGSLSWNDRVGAYFGMRYDDVDITNNDLVNIGNNIPASMHKFSHSFGVSAKVVDSLTLTGTLSKSFRTPTLADLYANPAFGGNPRLKPEEASNYELGVKWAAKAWSAASTLFLNRTTNEIGFDPNLTDATHLFGQNSNFGKTQRAGIENSFQVKCLSWLILKTSHTYTEATFKSNDNGGVQKSGDHIPMVPRNRLTTAFLIEPMENLNMNLNMVAVSKQVLVNDLDNDRNGRRLPAYTVFNLKTTYRLKSWEFNFGVENLLDEQYESAGSLGLAPSAFVTDPTLTDNFYVPAPGRSYSASVSYSW